MLIVAGRHEEVPPVGLGEVDGLPKPLQIPVAKLQGGETIPVEGGRVGVLKEREVVAAFGLEECRDCLVQFRREELPDPVLRRFGEIRR